MLASLVLLQKSSQGNKGTCARSRTRSPHSGGWEGSLKAAPPTRAALPRCVKTWGVGRRQSSSGREGGGGVRALQPQTERAGFFRPFFFPFSFFPFFQKAKPKPKLLGAPQKQTHRPAEQASMATGPALCRGDGPPGRPLRLSQLLLSLPRVWLPAQQLCWPHFL